MDAKNKTWVKELAWHGHAIGKRGTELCHLFPPKVNSYGVWEKMAYKRKGMGIWQYPLPFVEIIILIVFFLWQFFDFLFKKLGVRMPKFTSMMLAGIVLSQVCLTIPDSLVNDIIHPQNDYWPKLPETLGVFGFMIYWFLKGVKMDLGMVCRTGMKATVTGISTISVPIFVANFVFASKLRTGSKTLKPSEYNLITLLQSITAFTGIAKLLGDLKIFHSELGRIALSSAMVGDIVGLSFNFIGLWIWSESRRAAARESLAVITFIAFMVFILRPAMFWVIKNTPEGRPVKDIYIYAIIMAFFLSFLYWKKFSQFPPFGPFILGLAVPDGPPLGSALVQRFESFNAAVILPVFVSFCMKKLDGPWLLREIGKLKLLEGQVYEAASVVFLIFIAKFAASAIPPYASKMPLKDSIVLSLILSHKGIVELSYYLFSVDGKIITDKTFSIMAMFILLNSLFLPIAISYLYDPSKKFACYQKRNLVHLKPNLELRTLVCINKPGHITPMIKVLEASSLDEDSPLSCYVLHLVELLGQDSPNFISHQMQKPKVGSRSYSDNVIISFQHFHQNFWRSVSVDIFTSITAPKYMHQDICSLALDKIITLILLPFHRTWSVDRSTIVSDDDMIRNLNCNVLRRAPCSVGILVDRKTFRETTKTELRYQVCTIFVGGKDDREALALSKRMAPNLRVTLTVVRFVPDERKGESTRWDQMLDTAELKDVMRNNTTVGGEDNLVTYLEEVVRDGTETSKVLRLMASNHDLFIVGRSSGVDNAVTRGLEDWSEFEELGVIGDLLASPDFPSRASVLVVQQQHNISSS